MTSDAVEIGNAIRFLAATIGGAGIWIGSSVYAVALAINAEKPTPKGESKK